MNNTKRNYWGNKVEWVIEHLNFARKGSDWRGVDEMLDILNELGVELEDEPDGSVCMKIQSAGHEIVPPKYRNPPREEYRELCEAWLAGADLDVATHNGWCHKFLFYNHHEYRVNPDSILPQPDERKERIKKRLLNIDADKLAQLIIDSGIEL